jgi:hypothetical protein
MRAHTNSMVVIINGNGFINSTDLIVRIDEILIVPTYISYTQISFIAPQVLKEG